jgi:asparagine synthase (glutamine-hydrolysing)
MLNSIEIRMPFLDYRLVRYVFSLPMQSKLGGGYTKRILREAMKGILPEPIRTRKLKTGFNSPLQSWYRNELKTLLLDEVNSASFLSSNYWNGKVIRDFTEHAAKKDKWTEAESFHLWPILNAHLLFNKSKN